MPFLSGKKFLLLGIIVVLLAAVPLTVYLVQKQQEIRGRAQVSAVLSLKEGPGQSSPGSPITKNTGQSFVLDITLDPGNTTGYTIVNRVVYVGLSIKYDSTKLQIDQTAGGLAPTNVLGNTISAPSYTTGNVTAAWAVIDPSLQANQAITTFQKIATIHFIPIAPTDSPIEISFDRGYTTVATTISGTSPENNSLATMNSAWIAITGEPISPTLTVTPGGPTVTPTPVPGATATPTPSGQPPVCTALHVDRTSSGTAPFLIAFTANGNDPDGTISKVGFDFGDGPMQNITQGGGIGTNSVSIQASHTYQNPGSYTASAILTDNSNLTNDHNACTQTITVSQAATGQPTGRIVYITATPTPVPTGPTATPQTTVSLTQTPAVTSAPLTPAPTTVITPPGPGDKIIGIGIGGIVATIIGALIFLAL